MLILEWRLTLLALTVLPVFVIPARRVGRRLQDISRQQMQHNAAMNTQMTERFNVAGALLVKLFGDDRRELASFQKHAGGVRDAGIRQALLRTGVLRRPRPSSRRSARWRSTASAASSSCPASITTGTLVALAALVTRVYTPLTALTNARVDLMTSMVNFERVFEVLDAPEAIVERPGGDRPPRGRRSRRSGRRGSTFDDVRFRYPPAAETSVPSLEQRTPDTDPDRDVLDGITLDIAPGETIALVGASGAGKSTLVSLIPRLYDVTAGAVRIDGHDVRDLTLASLRRAIGVVSQDPHLFHVSIGDNLRYARPDATDAEVVAAAKAARIHDTIAALADGYDTVVGERGYRLSGGEKQRIAIARLLLKDPDVMILDEATSHLDNENEAQVQAALETALRGRTAIVIAHRLSTVRNADRIAVLDGGRIVEVGSHDELVARGGLYAAQLRAGGLFDDRRRVSHRRRIGVTRLSAAASAACRRRLPWRRQRHRRPRPWRRRRRRWRCPWPRRPRRRPCPWRRRRRPRPCRRRLRRRPWPCRLRLRRRPWPCRRRPRRRRRPCRRGGRPCP